MKASHIQAGLPSQSAAKKAKSMIDHQPDATSENDPTSRARRQRAPEGPGSAGAPEVGASLADVKNRHAKLLHQIRS